MAYAQMLSRMDKEDFESPSRDLTDPKVQKKFDLFLHCIIQKQALYQKAIRAYVAKYNQFKPTRVDYAPDRNEDGESEILRWQHHLNAVHAYIAVP